MDRHVAEVKFLEPFELGKNTAQDAGLEIKVYGKGGSGKRGPLLGTIRIGQGSFAWWGKSKKVKKESGKGKPTVRLAWSDFADRMQEISSEAPKRKPKKKTSLHAKAVVDVKRALMG